MCPESFGGVRFDMSRFNHVPSGHTLRRDTISSLINCSHLIDLTAILNLSQPSKAIFYILSQSLGFDNQLDGSEIIANCLGTHRKTT